MKKNNKKKVTKKPEAYCDQVTLNHPKKVTIKLPKPKKATKKPSLEKQVKTGLKKLLKTATPEIREELIKIIQDTTYGGPAPLSHNEASNQLDIIKQLVVPS